jgi:hypothetical protein
MWLDLKISSEERDLLLDILTTYRGTLRTEIHRTEVFAYKQDLKEQEELLGRILGKLHELEASAVVHSTPLGEQ